jgi:ketosteroid isomerase-like protein
MSCAQAIDRSPLCRWTAALLFAVCATLFLAPWSTFGQNASGQKTSMHRAEKHESRHEIDLLEESWRKAILGNDLSALESLLADDYLAITASGTLQTREQALDNLKSGRIHFDLLEITDRKVRFYGTTALVTSVARVKGSTLDGNVNGSYRYTRVYARNDKGIWKIVHFEASQIRGLE